MKPLQQHFQMKPLQQYFHMVLFIEYAVLTFKSVNEILWSNHSNETSLTELLYGATVLLGFYKKEFGIFTTFLLWQPLGVKG